MLEKLLPDIHHCEETPRRSVVKTISYRVVVFALDFILIYLFTGKLNIALGLTIASNIYSAFFYFIHERIWDKIKWGKFIFKKIN